MNKTTLKDWTKNNVPRDGLFWKDAAGRQISFLADTLAKELFADDAIAERSTLVISTHTSKSVLLPVVEIWLTVRDRHAARLVMRDNFHNWKVSVDARAPLAIDPTDLFEPGVKISSCYCEGMAGHVFGPHHSPSTQFTIELGSNEDVVEFCRRMKVALAEALS